MIMKSMHKKRKVDAVIFHVVACVIGFFYDLPDALASGKFI